jgi:hypothetical protein
MQNNYKNFDKQEELVISYDETKRIFVNRDNKRQLDELVELQNKRMAEFIENDNKRMEEYNQRIIDKYRETRKKALAAVLSIAIIGGGVLGVHHVDKIMDKGSDVVDIPDTNVVQVTTTYDDFLDFCNYMTETTGNYFAPSKENYELVIQSGELENFVKNNLNNGGKSL